MTSEEAIESLKLKFTSGNDLQVERNTILRKEYEAIKPLLTKLQFEECDTIIISAAISALGYPKATEIWLKILDQINKYRAM